MEKKVLAILFGGASPEHDISLQSAHAVITHLDTEKYAPVLVGITREGHWYRYRGDADHLLDGTWSESRYCTPAYISPCRKNAGLVEYGIGVTFFSRLDAAFPVMHGTLGEDGTIQGLLELAGIPIVGCGTLASALCMDKGMVHTMIKAAGIPVPDGFVCHKGTSMEEIRQAAEKVGYPLFVKPVCAGSSFGISRVEGEAALPSAVQAAFKHDARILVEEAVEGFEVGCAVMGGQEPVTGELDEVELDDGFFDFTEKYNLITSKIHVPARIGPEKTAQMKQTAVKIYRALGCRGFARVDMFLKPDGTVVFNEANTIPGFTAHSRFPAMMKQAGIGFAQLVDSLIETAVNP